MINKDLTIDVGFAGVTVTLPAWVAYTEHFILYAFVLLLLAARLAVAVRDWRRG